MLGRQVEEARGEGIDAIADMVADELDSEIMAEIISVGLDATVPGAGTLMRAIRYAMK
jgi:hypothetical protein